MAHIRLKNSNGIKYPDILYIVQNGILVNGFKGTLIKCEASSSGVRNSQFIQSGVFGLKALDTCHRADFQYKLSDVNDMYPDFKKKYTKMVYNVLFEHMKQKSQIFSATISLRNGGSYFELTNNIESQNVGGTNNNINLNINSFILVSGSNSIIAMEYGDRMGFTYVYLTN